MEEHAEVDNENRAENAVADHEHRKEVDFGVDSGQNLGLGVAEPSGESLFSKTAEPSGESFVSKTTRIFATAPFSASHDLLDPVGPQ